MDTGSYAVVLSLLAGTARALELWRASIQVAVVNVAVLNTLAEGRGQNLQSLLRGSGSAPYLDVASAIGKSMLDLCGNENSAQELERRLRQHAQTAVITATRRLRRHAWLDHLALAAIAFAGIDAAANESASAFKTGGLVAATLLWFANVRGARSIATRIYAGATALVESLLASLEQIQTFAGNPKPEVRVDSESP